MTDETATADQAVKGGVINMHFYCGFMPACMFVHLLADQVILVLKH